MASMPPPPGQPPAPPAPAPKQPVKQPVAAPTPEPVVFQPSVEQLEASTAGSAATCLMGDTGSGKSALLGTLAEYIWERYGKRTRLVTFDPGGYPDYVQALINVGIIVPWRPMTRDPEADLGLILGTIDRACRGFWPTTFTDASTGATAPACDLVPPQSTVNVLVCPNGHDAHLAQNALMFEGTFTCPTCNTPTNRQNCLRIRQDVTVTPGFEEFGAWCADGLTSMSTWAMVEMNLRAAHNLLGGVRGATNTQTSDGILYGTAGMSGVGFAQQRVWEWITNACKITGLVVPPVFTALKARGKDEGEGVMVYGPQVAGKAITTSIPSWFGNLLGTEAIALPNNKTEFRLYLKPYMTPPDPTRHLTKARIACLELPDYLADPDGATYENGKRFSVFSLGYFYGELWEKSVKGVEDRLAKRLKRTPPGQGKSDLPKEAGRLAVRAQPWSLSGSGNTASMPTLVQTQPLGSSVMPAAPGAAVMPPPPGGMVPAAPPAPIAVVQVQPAAPPAPATYPMTPAAPLPPAPAAPPPPPVPVAAAVPAPQAPKFAPPPGAPNPGPKLAPPASAPGAPNT